MKHLLIASFLLPVALLAGCQRTSGLAGRVDTEVKAKYLKTFNDPGSYEAVENKYDSVRYASYHRTLLDSIRQEEQVVKQKTAAIAASKKSESGLGYYGLAYGLEAARNLYDQLLAERQQDLADRDEAKQHRAAIVRDTVALAKLKLTSKDIYLVKIKHIYRTKNKAGALQRGAFDFVYYPKRDSLVLAKNTPDYAEATTTQ